MDAAKEALTQPRANGFIVTLEATYDLTTEVSQVPLRFGQELPASRQDALARQQSLEQRFLPCEYYQRTVCISGL